MSWLFLKDFLRILVFFILWVGGGAAILLLLKTKKMKNNGLKYSLISWIGILYLAILSIRIFKSDFKKEVITLKSFSGKWFKNSKKGDRNKDIHYFKDVDDKVINLKNVLKKRQISLFSIQNSKILEKELLKISEKDDLDYFHIDLNYAFNRYYSKTSLENFWSEFAIALIKKISSKKNKKVSLIFLWTLQVNSKRKEISTLSYAKQMKKDDEEKYKINHFVEIVQTLTQNLRNFNILLITESDQLLFYLKGSALSRIMSVYKLTSHRLKLDEQGIPYRNVKVSEVDREKRLDFNEQKIKEDRISKREKQRDKRWKRYSKLKTKEEQEAEMMKDARKLEEDFMETRYQRQQRIKDFIVDVEDRHNKQVLLAVLKGSKTIGKNEWVAINQIPDFARLEDRFNYLVDRRVFERSGDLVRFINDDVFLFYSYELIGNLGDAIQQNLRKGKKKKKRRRKKKRSWLVRFLWDLD